MSTPKEIEIKLELSPATLPRLKKIPLMRSRKGATKRSAEVSVYFDTDKHTLRRKGLMLRVRRIGNRYIQTIKATGKSGLFERDEWEAASRAPSPTSIWRGALRWRRWQDANCATGSNRCSRRGWRVPSIH